MRKCNKCNGIGYIPQYKEYNNGICYKCNGVGYLFEEPEHKEEFFRVKYLFENEIIDLGIDICDYFNMSKKEREKFIKSADEELEHEKDMIECSKLDVASEAGFDSYEEYEENMRYECIDDPYFF